MAGGASYTRIVFNRSQLDKVLKSRNGEVGRFMAKEGNRIANKAKVLVSGGPHGYWNGTYYGSAPGGPPGVRTGRGRAGIGSRLVSVDGQVAVEVGSAAEYMGILEKRSHAPYPWLKPAAEACGYRVS